jgi:hypothetical protein
MSQFVRSRGIGCFKCGRETAEWAKTGVNKRGPWAICLPCARKGRP